VVFTASRSRAWLAVAAVVAAACAAVPAGAVAASGDLVPGVTSPPARHVRFDRNCPPNGPRVASPQTPPDQDVDGDGRPDYFMGSWTFVNDRSYGLVVTLWCLKRRPATRVVNGHRRLRHFNDLFALQLATRAGPGQPLITRVAPRRPICPFVEGINLGLGFRPHACLGIAQPPFDQIPPVVAWISINPHLPGDDLPNEKAQETLFWPQPDGTVAQAQIVETRTGGHRFIGYFAVGGAVKPGQALSPPERTALIAEMNADKQRARVDNRGCAQPSFGSGPGSA